MSKEAWEMWLPFNKIERVTDRFKIIANYIYGRIFCPLDLGWLSRGVRATTFVSWVKLASALYQSAPPKDYLISMKLQHEQSDCKLFTFQREGALSRQTHRIIVLMFRHLSIGAVSVCFQQGNNLKEFSFNLRVQAISWGDRCAAEIFCSCAGCLKSNIKIKRIKEFTFITLSRYQATKRGAIQS